MIERDQRIAALLVALDGRTVDGDDVEFAVVVAIDQADAAAHGFDNVFFVGRRNVRDGEASLLGDVFKLWTSAERVIASSRQLENVAGRFAAAARHPHGKQSTEKQRKQRSHRKGDYIAADEEQFCGTGAERP